MDNENTVEHATMMSGGGYHVRSDAPLVERVCPLPDWIDVQRESGRKVYRRTIVVLTDWEEVNGPIPATTFT